MLVLCGVCRGGALYVGVCLNQLITISKKKPHCMGLVFQDKICCNFYIAHASSWTISIYNGLRSLYILGDIIFLLLCAETV
jgi:hypothetical protein